MALTLDIKGLAGFVNADELAAMRPEVARAHALLRGGTGAGGDFLGWLELPNEQDQEEYSRIKAAAAKIRADSDVLVVIGIGGSYLGARMAIEFLNSQMHNLKDGVKIFFAGNNISSSYLTGVLEQCEGREVSVNVISKSGTTTEPALAFRVFKQYMERRYGKQGAAKRIFATTDKVRGTLRGLADAEGYESFVIPDNIGGRYSVLTAVGLLPIAVAGADIDALMGGARAANAALNGGFEGNDAYRYAALRNLLYRKGKGIEILASYEADMQYVAEWWKQLFGESEGKDGKGIYPASVVYSSDLHSMGQYVQSGVRSLFETVINVRKPKCEMLIPKDAQSSDGLQFVEGCSFGYVNENAFLGTLLAHTDGGVPNIVLDLPEMNEHELGYMIQFFLIACGMSAYILGVNPFDQPGVEAYKNNMYALLGKPGYEKLRGELRARL